MKELKLRDYVVDESCTRIELLAVIEHCEDVMELRNSEWLKASDLRNKCLEMIYHRQYKF